MLKPIIIALGLIMGMQAPVFAEAQTKQVCKDVVGKDGKPSKNKDGSIKQQCKTIKVHKKLEGTPVPVKK